MQTWLDAYIDTIAASVRAVAARGGVALPSSMRGDLNLVAHALMRMVGQTNALLGSPEAVRVAYNKGDQLAHEIGGIIDATPFLMRAIYGADHSGGSHTPVAIRPTRALCDDLADAGLPDGAGDTVRGLLDEHSHWYVDLPHHALRVEDTQARALFVTAGPDGHKVSVVLTRPGQDELCGRLAWRFGDRTMYAGYRMAGRGDPALLIEQVEAFLGLLLLYRSTAERDRRPPVPHATAEDLDRNPRKLRQNRKKTSLFRVEGLDAPADRFGRTAAERPTGGWALGWRTTVKGHFRWQAHGPRHSLRKLIWIDAFRRGPDGALERQPIERLA